MNLFTNNERKRYEVLSNTSISESGHEAMILYVPLDNPSMAIVCSGGLDCVVMAQKLLYWKTR